MEKLNVVISQRNMQVVTMYIIICWQNVLFCASLRLPVTAWKEGGETELFKARVPGTYCLKIYTADYVMKVNLALAQRRRDAVVVIHRSGIDNASVVRPRVRICHCYSFSLESRRHRRRRRRRRPASDFDLAQYTSDSTSQFFGTFLRATAWARN